MLCMYRMKGVREKPPRIKAEIEERRDFLETACLYVIVHSKNSTMSIQHSRREGFDIFEATTMVDTHPCWLWWFLYKNHQQPIHTSLIVFGLEKEEGRRKEGAPEPKTGSSSLFSTTVVVQLYICTVYVANPIILVFMMVIMVMMMIINDFWPLFLQLQNTQKM